MKTAKTLKFFKIFFLLIFIPGLGNAEHYISLYGSGNAPTKIGIILLGDSGQNNAEQVAVAHAIKSYCQHNLCSFGLLLGDNFYPNGVNGNEDPLFNSTFAEPYKELNFKFYPVLGNHDVRGDWRAEISYVNQHWQMPDRYYLIDAAWLNIFAIDTNLYINFLNDEHGEQRDWLESSLAKSKARWKIVYGHHPVFSSGVHGDTWNLKTLLRPFLEQDHVDFYISGHDHDLELIKDKDIKYVISGAGSKTRSISPGKNSAFTFSGNGFAHLLLTANTAKITFVDSKNKVLYVEEFSKLTKD